MSNEKIIQWCKSKDFQNPIHLSALLSIFNPDIDELNAWNISCIDANHYIINDTHYYIYSEEDQNTNLAQYKQSIQDDYLFEVPEELHEFIDWESFWKENPITLEMYTEGLDKIIFKNIIYYYCER